MKQNYTYSKGNYAVINGELRHVSVDRKYSEDGEHIKYVLGSLGEYEDIKLYESREDFEKGEVGTDYAPFDSEYTMNAEGQVALWKMEGGEPKEEWFDNLAVEIHGNCAPVVPKGWYSSREECLRNETYIEVQDDGTKVEHMGILQRIRLSEEQEGYLKGVLLPALNGCKKVGIQLVASTWDEILYAYNSKNFTKESWDCESNRPQTAHLCDMRLVTRNIFCVGDDTVIYNVEGEK